MSSGAGVFSDTSSDEGEDTEIPNSVVFKLYEKNRDRPKFAWACIKYLFSLETLLSSTVYKKKSTRPGLNGTKLNKVKECVFNFFPAEEQAAEAAWQECVTRINSNMRAKRDRMKLKN